MLLGSGAVAVTTLTPSAGFKYQSARGLHHANGGISRLEGNDSVESLLPGETIKCIVERTLQKTFKRLPPLPCAASSFRLLERLLSF